MAGTAPDDAFVELMTSNQARLRAYALLLLRNPSDADDVVQNACVDLWKKRRQYDPDRPFLPWASRVVLVEVLRHRRKRATDKLMFDEALMTTLATECAERLDLLDQRKELLRGCVQKLSGQDQTLLSDRYRHGVRPQELAAKRGRPATTVYSALARIREALHRCVEAGMARDAHPSG